MEKKFSRSGDFESLGCLGQGQIQKFFEETFDFFLYGRKSLGGALGFFS